MKQLSVHYATVNIGRSPLRPMLTAVSIDATCVAADLAAGILLGLVGSLPPTIRRSRSAILTALKVDLV